MPKIEGKQIPLSLRSSEEEVGNTELEGCCEVTQGAN